MNVEMFTAVTAVIGAVAAAIGAVAGLWNAYQFSVLKGRVDTQETAFNAHVNAPGMHGQQPPYPDRAR